MIRRLLLLSVVFFWLSSSSSSQELTSDQSISGNVLDPSTIEGSYNYCTPGVNCWSGYSGGSRPNWSSSLGWSAYWGYGGGILKWTSSINTALQESGLQIDGYHYRWRVKNKDTNANQGDGDDYMRISVRIYDSTGKEVWGKQYNLDGYYDWSYFRGTEFFDESLIADDLSNVIIRAEGDDPGYWAGYYGPEFNVSDSYVKFIYSTIPVDPCDEVPVVDPSCENFIGAAPQEDPAVKELVIIESTGSIPLSEDELTVLESLEEEEETFEEEQPEQAEEEESNNVDALAVARNAEASALADAAATIENTLEATSLSLEQDMATTQQINQQAQNQSQQSMQEAEQSQQLSMDMANEINQSLSSSESTNETEQAMSTLDTIEINIETDVATTNELNEIDSTQVTSLSTNTQSNQQQESMDDGSDIDVSSYITQQQQEPMVELEITVDTFEIAALDNAINDAVMNLIKMEQNIIREQVEESQQEEELTEPVSNDKEDELVAAALAGSDDEDAQAALLGFNPNFRAYQQPQMTDAEFYKPKDIYAGQENYDNPNARFFNGASDATHRKMVRQQYEGN